MNAMKMREAIGGRKPTAEEKEAVSVVATIEAGMILAIEDEIGRHLSREELKDIVSRFAQLPFEDAFPMLGKTDRQEAWQA